MVDIPAPRDGASTEEEVRPHLYLFDLRLCDLDILKEKMANEFANSGDPDQTPYSALFASFPLRVSSKEYCLTI